MDSNSLMATLAQGAPFFIAFLFSLCFHELAHGYVAKLKGDRTAEMMGRLSMNPMVHADIVGTFVLPAFAIFGGGILFGWAKPVPVNSRNLERPKEDMFWIALAGPLSNFLLAFVFGVMLVIVAPFLMGSPGGMSRFSMQLLDTLVLINLFLAFFNLIPMHPLDGGKVLARFLPTEANRWMEDNQMALNVSLILLFVMGGFRFLAVPVYWLKDSIYSLSYLIS